MTISSIKKKGRTSLFTLKGKIKADFKLIDKLILNLSDHDRKQIYKFLDKQIEIAFKAGKKVEGESWLKAIKKNRQSQVSPTGERIR